ncbi:MULTISPECIES: ABC transporter ATP-binding protein [unclassified Mesorhizobium]|uniref:ABC transporter ATP-binding protein n=1 Tax=unclassified Mesorhizobium TaxID=325217 RepID=UPI001093C2DD|nr:MULTISPECIES: ABC transporter ATP-binding protein [unclassified Mesorhizobium]TGS42837.1 ABC transporter ATP-binding protein [Mesorhizobium sp. M8A.F.Ca.ET.182.01.1.1]TGS79839.1 ABC transporter ATP-binding protein [Mesorhizobium sp. M8A.F.Ca.ET.181.01.1.1]
MVSNAPGSPPLHSTSAMAVELAAITKRFGAFIANDGIDLVVRRGEIHAIIGENGAGKTTLMNILFGLLQPDEGSIRLNGETTVVADPAAAIKAGLGMVHQHFKLVPSLSVADNVFLGMEIRRHGLIDHAAQIERTRDLSKRFGLHVDPTERVGLLSVGIEQRIEILKVLVRGARTIILDEPTAVLTPQESRELFQTLRSFVAEGMTVIFISHHLEEVMEVSDTVTVLRNGRKVATRPASELSKDELVRMMVGREVSFDRRPRAALHGGAVLEVKDLWARDDRRLPAVRGASFTVRAGEVVGIAGVAGNGQTELAEVLSGLRPASHGEAWLKGRDLTMLSPAAIREAGLAHVPGDRMVRGVDRNASIAANTLMGRQHRAPWSRGGVLDWKAIAGNAGELIKSFDIRAQGSGDPVKRLSGGNIQKVVLAREFTNGADFLLIDQPTRGVDIGAQEAIHDEIMRQRAAGRAILLISVQLDELAALADRILVVFNGRIMGEVAGDDADEDRIGMMMAGVSPELEPA